MVAWKLTRAFVKPKGINKIREGLHGYERQFYKCLWGAYGSDGTQKAGPIWKPLSTVFFV